MAALLTASHPELSKRIAVDGFSNNVLEEVFSYVADTGDRLTQIGAVEVGLRVINDRPGLEATLAKLISTLRNDTGNSKGSGYVLQSSLFSLVDSELSRRRILTGVPPFYRRLAALAHSSVVYRCIAKSGVDIDSFCKFIDSNLAPRFHIQTLVDMRLEPRWESTFAAPVYLRAQFLSRIVSSASARSNAIDSPRLHSLLLGDGATSVQSEMKFPAWYFAGPLEGTFGLTRDLPSDWISLIEQQLSSKDVTPNSFIGLVNASFLGSIGSDHTDLASDALSRGRYRLSRIESKSQLISVLYGVARVAAYARSWKLAQAVRVISRNYRDDREFSLSIDEELRIILMSGASFGELTEWCEFVGQWMVESAQANVDDDESRDHLYWSLQILCDIVPELWVSCGSADAALSGEYQSRW